MMELKGLGGMPPSRKQLKIDVKILQIEHIKFFM